MATTQQGKFSTTYGHINPPTILDTAYRERTKKYKMMIPSLIPKDFAPLESCYSTPLIAMLACNEWNIRRKLDGQNIRIHWDGEQALWNGKSDEFNCGSDFTQYMNETFLEQIFEEKFGRDKEVLIFGEKMGARTQSNELGLERDELIIFDVNINGFWLDRKGVQQIAEYFDVKTCYDFMGNDAQKTKTWTLPTLIHAVATGQFKAWEGVVATPIVECYDRDKQRVIVKIKNRDYFRNELENVSLLEMLSLS